MRVATNGPGSGRSLMNLQAIFASLVILLSGTMCEQADARPPQVRQEAGRGSMGYSTWNLPNAANVKRYRRDAEQGSAPAQFYLSMMYNSGYGVRKNHAEAVKWLLKAVEQDHAQAQNNLGGMYNSGLGVTPDYAEAVKWFRKAAMQGDVAAQKNLAAKYGNGQGVPQNYAEAYVWSSIAVMSGNKRAIESRDYAASALSPEDLSMARKRATELNREIQQRIADQ